MIEHAESNRNEPAGISDLPLSLVSGMEKVASDGPKRVHEPAFAVHPEVLKYGGKDTLIYNLDVSLISDLFDLLTPENMIVEFLGLADTDGRRPIWRSRGVSSIMA